MQNLKTKSAKLTCTETKKIVVKNEKKKSLQPFSKELFTFPSEGIRHSNLNFNVKMTGQ